MFLCAPHRKCDSWRCTHRHDWHASLVIRFAFPMQPGCNLAGACSRFAAHAGSFATVSWWQPDQPKVVLHVVLLWVLQLIVHYTYPVLIVHVYNLFMFKWLHVDVIDIHLWFYELDPPRFYFVVNKPCPMWSQNIANVSIGSSLRQKEKKGCDRCRAATFHSSSFVQMFRHNGFCGVGVWVTQGVWKRLYKYVPLQIHKIVGSMRGYSRWFIWWKMRSDIYDSAAFSWLGILWFAWNLSHTSSHDGSWAQDRSKHSAFKLPSS